MKLKVFFILSGFILTLIDTAFGRYSDSTFYQNVSLELSGSVKPAVSGRSKFYIQSGFNWERYSKSDIRFEGPGYDFTLRDVVAHNQPSKGSLQYNIHFGYKLNDKYSILLGWDHMKYVVDIPQQVRINGYIESTVSDPAIPTGQYEGVYNEELITLNPDFLTLEYTDGFNYIKLGGERQQPLLSFGKGNSKLGLTTGLAAGVIMPRADVKLFNVGDNNKLNIAGWAASANAGLKLNITKSLYLQGSLEGGYAKMFHVYTTGRNDVDKASQQLTFLQNYWLIGVEF
ncbi:MAG: hypothetical protein ABI390_02820 [Daejeonella sp.]